MRYQDFHLRLSRSGERYTVHARCEPHAVSEIVPFDAARFSGLTDVELDALGGVEAMGAELFDAVFRDQVRDLYQHARGRAVQDQGGLRIRLHFDARDRDARLLMRVPWELLFDSRHGAGVFLALDPRTPVVRTLDTTAEMLAPWTGPIRRVLLVLASPRTLPAVGLDRDADIIAETFERAGVQADILWHASRESLLQALHDRPYGIVHVSCHGDFGQDDEEGALWLEDENGEPDPVPARIFAECFAGVRAPGLVCVAACQSADPGRSSRGVLPFGSVAAALAGMGLPAVLAMQTTVSDESARRFTTQFYRAVVRGVPLEAAVAEARLPLRAKRPDIGDWGIPIMFVRDAAASPPDRADAGTSDDAGHRPSPDAPPRGLPRWQRNDIVAPGAAIGAININGDVGTIITDTAGMTDTTRKKHER